MSEWKPIETVDRNALIELKVGKYEFVARFEYIDDDEEGKPLHAWQAIDDDEAPPCWDEGICWGSNANEQASKKPTHWRYPHPATRSGGE
jgi:hypothetical protein